MIRSVSLKRHVTVSSTRTAVLVICSRTVLSKSASEWNGVGQTLEAGRFSDLGIAAWPSNLSLWYVIGIGATTTSSAASNNSGADCKLPRWLKYSTRQLFGGLY